MNGVKDAARGETGARKATSAGQEMRDTKERVSEYRKVCCNCVPGSGAFLVVRLALKDTCTDEK